VSTLCICENGFKYMSHLNKKNKGSLFQNVFEFTTWFIKISEDHPCLSLRSTCFYCMNLISKSCTGANLLGKFGWHTFQPNRLTQPKSLYSTLCSMSLDNNPYDFGVYSSFNSAIILYNLNRAKANFSLKEANFSIKQTKFSLKEVKRYFDCDLSAVEKEFLSEKMRTDYWSKKDEEFIKVVESNKIGYLFESICVPIRTSLMAAEMCSTDRSQIVDSFNSNAVSFKENCSSDACFYCKSISSGPTESNLNGQIQSEIVNLINQLTPMINLDKKLSSLTRLKHSNPKEFSLCLHNYIFIHFLSKLKIKFYLRNFIQELFKEMSLNV
jgi:hypothetical protein